MPRLSIITINYNNCKGLQKTIQSVFTQTFKDYEYIIIDGGSTDGSTDIIKNTADGLSYWISEPDKGIYNAMNKGIVQAKGEYLQFLNSGDSFSDEHILSGIFSTARTADIVYGDINSSYADGSKKRLRSPHGDELSMMPFFTHNLAHPASFIKKELFNKGLYDENYRIVADNKFFIDRIILDNCSLDYINKVLINFDMGGLSSDPVNWEKTNEERRKLITELLPPRVLKDYDSFLMVRDSKLLPYIPVLNNSTGFQNLVAGVVGLMVKCYCLFRGTGKNRNKK